MTLAPTPGQTVGPFFHYAMPFPGDSDLVAPSHPGRIQLQGTVFDGAGQPVPDALIEIWQFDADGAVPRAQGSLDRDGFTFTGWGRCATDRTGRYSFATVAPGPPAPGGPAFFTVCVFARGLLDRLFTRAYLPSEAAADALLNSLTAQQRSTLMTTATATGFQFDIHLQGEAETVFLDHHA